MNTWSFINWLPIVISAFALGFSVFVFFFDFETRRLQRIINKDIVKKNKKEQEDEKKAFIEAVIINESSGNRKINIRNIRRAKAKNIRVTFPSSPNLFKGKFPEVIELYSHHEFSTKYNVHTDLPRIIGIEIRWDDEFKKNNINEQKIQLY